jgi:hydroxymethylpyrimidine kinase/phosphomethylpyrimidine kinase
MSANAGNHPPENSFSIACTIAGSDSGGGAGIQADLKTFFALGVHGTSVLTAVTAQNTQGVSAWEAVTQTLVLQQLEAITRDLRPAAIKTGMLADASLIVEISKFLKSLNIPLIIDPVLIASSGDALSKGGAPEAYMEHLFPLASLVTPNHPEVKALTGVEINSSDDAIDAAEKLMATGCGAVLIKGGHGSDGVVEDLFFSSTGHRVFRHPRLEGVFHGTGCTLSAAITAYVARGWDLEPAVEGGINLVCRAMAGAVQAGNGTLMVLNVPTG